MYYVYTSISVRRALLCILVPFISPCRFLVSFKIRLPSSNYNNIIIVLYILIIVIFYLILWKQHQLVSFDWPSLVSCVVRQHGHYHEKEVM